MLPIPATETKLAEADFFFRKLAKVGGEIVCPEPEAFGYYLSAFVSAGRSVTFALQAERKGEYDNWFPAWRASLSDDQPSLLADFNDHRIAAVKQRGIDLSYHEEEISQSEFLFAAAREGVDIQVWGALPGSVAPTYHRRVRTLLAGGAQAEVIAAASEYLDLLKRMVDEFKSHHSGSAPS